MVVLTRTATPKACELQENLIISRLHATSSSSVHLDSFALTCIDFTGFRFYLTILSRDLVGLRCFILGGFKTLLTSEVCNCRLE